jgi:hypothetical protein
VPRFLGRETVKKGVAMPSLELKSFERADEVRSFDKLRLDVVKFGDATIGRFTMQPGWKWSESVKPTAGTDWCEQMHFAHQLSGRLHIRMKDGTEFETGPGDVSVLPAGHDAWVVGSEPVVLVDWTGAGTYGQR